MSVREYFCPLCRSESLKWFITLLKNEDAAIGYVFLQPVTDVRTPSFIHPSPVRASGQRLEEEEEEEA